MVKVSVVIPTYNHSDYIVGAIDSVLGQDCGKYKQEIIVIDDGSTDDTGVKLKKYKNKIRYIELEHTGKPAHVRNIGIKSAKGELIAFLDADDIWLPNKINKQLAYFKDPNTVLCFSNASLIDSSGVTKNKTVVDPKKLTNETNFNKLIKENIISTSTVVARKTAIESVGYFEESNELLAHEDYELWLQMIAKYQDGFKTVNDTLALYRQHDKNVSSVNQSMALKRLVRVYNKLWEFNLNKLQRNQLENQIFNINSSFSRVSKSKYANTPAISVVMSVFNGGDCLYASIKSILDQTYKNFEFIIIDDGSLDNTAKIIKIFNDDRIRLIHQNNHGLVYSLNKGVELARGEFIARMDADDISMPTRLDKELSWLTKNEKRGLVGSFFTYIDEESSKPSITLYTPTKHLDLRRMMYIVNPFAHGSTMFRKTAFEQAGGYREEYYKVEDYDLWRRIVSNWQIGQIPESLYWYRISQNSISQKHSKEQNKLALKIAKDQLKTTVYAKSIKKILKDNKFYKNMDNDFSTEICEQYVGQQQRLAFEFLIRGRLRTGYKTALASIILNIHSFKHLWKIMVWAPFKRLSGKTVK